MRCTLAGCSSKSGLCKFLCIQCTSEDSTACSVCALVTSKESAVQAQVIAGALTPACCELLHQDETVSRQVLLFSKGSAASGLTKMHRMKAMFVQNLGRSSG